MRLPEHVRPKRYQIDLTSHPADATFSGRVVMALVVDRDCDRIQMHAKHLELSEATIGGQPATIELDEKNELVSFIAPVKAGDAELVVRFSGKPNPGMHGLYLASDGGERAICTQCEATDARGIFPCFDEPAFKARFELKVRTRPDVIALGNGELQKSEETTEERVWHFRETGVISSYLFALVIGDFAGTDAIHSGDTPLRVWAMRGKEGQAKFANRFTEKLFPYYESYFAQPYAYQKYDQVAVPGFDAGAMENVGLVLFRQNLLLMEPSSASWNQEKLIAKVIAHELAHMWFGNLVTMQWWDDLWLNEAFAEWFAHKGTDAIAPDYEVWNDFQADKNRALVDDALPTTHPIYTAVETPSQAIEMFDVITYQKGCAVMRMLENYLGDDPFRRGIQSYMAEFAERNARGADLWRHLASASSQPVGALMESWIEQPGFPMVTARLEENRLALSQRRFFSSPSAAQADNDQTWNVPMVVRFGDDEGEKEHRFILDSKEASVTLPAKGAVKWFYPNRDEIGFYRCDVALERAAERLSSVEQMGYVEDQWALVRNASSTVDRFLPVLESLASSRDHNVVRAVTDRLGTLERVLQDAGDETALQAHRDKIAQLIGPHLEELGFEPAAKESQSDGQRRALAIHALASVARVPATIEACVTWADKERADPRSVDANLAGTLVGIAAKFGDAERHAAWVATYLERKSGGAAPQDSLRYLYTLAAFRKPELVEKTLGHLDDGVVPQEAVGSILSQLLGGRHSRLAAWAYLQRNWTELRARVGDMGISRVVEAVGALPGDRRQEIVAFFEKNPPAGAERALARALEGLDQREELYARITPQLMALLK